SLMPPFCCIGIVCVFIRSTKSRTRSGLTVMMLTEYQLRVGAAAACDPLAPPCATARSVHASTDTMTTNARAANRTRFMTASRLSVVIGGYWERPTLRLSLWECKEFLAQVQQ